MGMDVPVNASDEDLFHIGMELVNEIDHAGSDGENRALLLRPIPERCNFLIAACNHDYGRH